MGRFLVESGGGLNGAYGAGAIRALLRECAYTYDGYAGVSVGAINLAYLAQFPDAEVPAAALSLQDLWRSIDERSDIVSERGFDVWEWLAERVDEIAKFALVLTKHPSVFLTKPLRRLLRQHIDPARIRASGKRLRVAAVDLRSGEVRVWKETSEDILDGVMASAAFPAAFPPVPTADGYFLDGGLREVTPLSQAFEMNAGQPDPEFHVIVHDREKVAPWNVAKPNGLQVMERVLSILMDEITENDLKMAQMRNELARTGAPHAPGDVIATLRIMRQRHTVSGPPIDIDVEGVRRQMTFGWGDAIAAAAAWGNAHALALAGPRDPSDLGPLPGRPVVIT